MSIRKEKQPKIEVNNQLKFVRMTLYKHITQSTGFDAGNEGERNTEDTRSVNSKKGKVVYTPRHVC